VRLGFKKDERIILLDNNPEFVVSGSSPWWRPWRWANASSAPIGRHLDGMEGEAGFLAPEPKNQFTNTRADRADSYERFSHAFEFLVNDVGMVFFFALAAKEVVEATSANSGALTGPTWASAVRSPSPIW